MDDLIWIWLVPLFPLFGVVLNGLVLCAFPKVRQKYAGHVASAMSGLAFVVALICAASLGGILKGAAWKDAWVYDWISAGDLVVPMALRIDPLSVTMTLVVTGVGTLIHLFSIGYMAGDPRYPRFFTYLNLFMFAMLILVLANNYVLLFVGWEGVGLCSYLLIGYYFERVSAAQAGKKAFLINRVGDAAFLLGMFALFSYTRSLVFNTPDGTGALDRAGLLQGATLWGLPVVTVICLLLLIGATGKSAQLPLYMWLPDAMEGPTPVSALIHAATMVTAGVYMIARSAALFGQSHEAQTVVAAIGIITAFWAALIAIKQFDIKRVLAYSTVSQLGFMFAGVGVGAYAAGVSHLVTHAFFKALMFLGAGAVMHALEGQLDMRKMGNVKRYMPVTYATFFVGWLAISGIPPLSGFWSKDKILEEAAANGFAWVAVLGSIVAGMTAFYMTRMFTTVFWGSERIELGDEGHGGDAQEHGPASVQAHAKEHHGHTHDAHGHAHDHHGHTHDHDGHGAHGHGHAHVHPEQWVMNIPLIALAAAAFLGGLVVFYLPRFLYGVTHAMVPHAAVESHGAAAGHGAGGLPPVWEWPTIQAFTDPAHAWPAWLSLGCAAVGLLLALSMQKQFERGWGPEAFGLLDRLYEGTLHAIFVRGGSLLADASYFFDRTVIDGLVNGVGKMVDFLAESLRTLQTGYVRNYALVMLAGAVFVVACFLLILQQWPMAVYLRLGAIAAAVIVVAYILSAIMNRRLRTSAGPEA